MCKYLLSINKSKTKIMENQVKLVEETLVQSSKSEFPTIEIMKIFPKKEGKDTQMMTLKWITRKTDNSSIGNGIAYLLGKFINNVEKRTTVVNLDPDLISGLNLKPGDNLNEIFKKNDIPPQRISISEITESELDNLSNNQKIGYNQKINPTTGEILKNNDEIIYRKVHLTDINVEDKYLSTTGSSFDNNSEPTV